MRTLLRPARRAAAWLAAILLAGSAVILPAARGAQAAPPERVYLLTIDGTVDGALPAYVARGLRLAEKAGAFAVILELRTPGGFVGAAMRIRDDILAADVPVIAWVRDRALSAGVLIALAAEKIYMQPGSTMGAAETRPKEEKTLSAWRGELEATAERRGRDPQVAAAMADARVEIPGLVEAGQLLTLTAAQAGRIGFIDGTAETRADLLLKLGLGDASVTEVRPSASEQLARWLTHPLVAPGLLAIGLAGLLVELFAPGFGIPGALGVLALALYFGGGLLAGITGWGAILLFLAGVLGLVVEILVPGFGLPGVAGLALLIAGIYLSSPTPVQALTSIAVALVMLAATVFALARAGLLHRFVSRLMLDAAQRDSAGYVSRPRHEDLLGREGRALSPLRPSGSAEIDGSRWEVVSEGEFVAPGTPLRVVRVEGLRLVVRPLDEARTAQPAGPYGEAEAPPPPGAPHGAGS